jgi:S-adenosylmethionine decarboxylase
MLGYHYIWDVYDCNPQKLAYSDSIKILLNEIVKDTNIRKVSESYKQFEPIGATGIILLEESHLSIHTWPENGFAAIDLFSCKQIEPSSISEILKDYFKTQNIEFKELGRGKNILSLV